MNPDDTITTGWEQKTDKRGRRFYEKLPDYLLPPDQDFEKGWVRWIHPRLSADYSAQQTEMLNLQHHTMRLEQHEQMNTHDPTRFNFFAYGSARGKRTSSFLLLVPFRSKIPRRCCVPTSPFPETPKRRGVSCNHICRMLEPSFAAFVLSISHLISIMLLLLLLLLLLKLV